MVNNNLTKLLIVEDNKDTRLLLKEYFESLDYYIEICENGVEALAILKKKEFTILITDIRMPKMDGITLIGEVKRIYPKLGLIMMTAFSSVYSEVDVRRVGVDDYISKPFNFEDMKEKVEKLTYQIEMMKPKKT